MVAVDFIIKTISILSDSTIPLKVLNDLQEALIPVLSNKFSSHWYPSNPKKGSGYRSLYLGNFLDPLIRTACIRSNIDPNLISKVFQNTDLYLFVDPFSTSFRKGPNGRVIRVLYEYNDKQNPSFNLDDISVSDLMDLSFEQLLGCNETIGQAEASDIFDGPNATFSDIDFSKPPPNITKSFDLQSTADAQFFSDGLSQLLSDLTLLSRNRYDLFSVASYGPYSDLPYHITISKCSDSCMCKNERVITTQVTLPFSQ